MLSSARRRMSGLERSIQLRIAAERHQANVLERPAEEVAFDQNRVLNRLDELSSRAEELGQISTSVRCEELIGKHLGLFVDRSDPKFLLEMDPSDWTAAQKDVLVDHALRKYTGGDPERMAFLKRRAQIQAGVAVDVELKPPDTVQG